MKLNEAEERREAGCRGGAVESRRGQGGSFIARQVALARRGRFARRDRVSAAVPH